MRWSTKPETAEALRAKAEQCTRLARESLDELIWSELKVMAAEFEAQAVAVETAAEQSEGHCSVA